MEHIKGETQTCTEGLTPNDGAYAIAYWKDAEGNLVDRSQAVSGIIIEYSENNEALHRTYFSTSRNCSHGD